MAKRAGCQSQLERALTKGVLSVWLLGALLAMVDRHMSRAEVGGTAVQSLWSLLLENPMAAA